MTKGKKAKPAPLPVTTENIGKAAQTGSIKALVELADAFNRVALTGPFATELPLFCSVFVGGEKNCYRRMNIGIGTKFEPLHIAIGKKQGLIFAFKATSQLQREGQPVERIEVSWDDIINNFGDLSDAIEERLNKLRDETLLVADINGTVKAAIDKNPSMHAILTKGFDLAQIHAKQSAQDDSLAEIPGFGMF